MCKNQREEVSQLGKLKGEILKNEGNSVALEVLFFETWMKKVISIVRHSTRLIVLQLLCRKPIISFVCMHALPPGLSTNEKDRFYEQLLTLVTTVRALQRI